MREDESWQLKEDLKLGSGANVLIQSKYPIRSKDLIQSEVPFVKSKDPIGSGARMRSGPEQGSFLRVRIRSGPEQGSNPVQSKDGFGAPPPHSPLLSLSFLRGA